MTHRLQVACWLVAALVLAGCQHPLPSVSLRGGGHSVQAAPTRWCPQGKACVSHRLRVPVIKVAPTAAVTIEVPDTVANRPWIVLVDGRAASPLQRRSHSYRLKPVPAPVTVEVVTVDTDGSRVLQRDRWVFWVTPAG